MNLLDHNSRADLEGAHRARATPFFFQIRFFGYTDFVYVRRLNTLRPKQDGRRFPDDTFERIFLNETVIILIKISVKFVPNGPINNIPALVQIMAWRRPGDKPLSEPMLGRSLTHICVTRPQWVKIYSIVKNVFEIYRPPAIQIHPPPPPPFHLRHP